MLAHRIKGLACLHRAILFVGIAASFWAYLFLHRAIGFHPLSVNFEPGLYFLATLVGAIWSCRIVKSVDTRIGSMRLLEATRLSFHQVARIAGGLLVVAFVTRDLDVSRSFILGYFVVLGMVTMTVNFFAPRVLTRAFFRARPLRTVIYADAREATRLADWIHSHGRYGIEIVGYCNDEGRYQADTPLHYLGTRKDFERLVHTSIIDQVVADQRLFSAEEARAFADYCEHAGARARFYLNIESLFPDMPVLSEHCGTYSFASYTPEPLENPLNRVLKRGFDLAVAVPVALFVLPPVALLTAIFQRVQSPGPVFYRQQRTGMNRRRFSIYKFRTMHMNDVAARQATKNDSRIYAFGKFLRKTSLDELPQVLNVLRGEMSINGPRPHLIDHDDLFAKTVTNYKVRHFVKPGITGLAQSKGLRGEVTEHKLILNRVRYDMFYVAKWSLWMDIKIVVETAIQIIRPPKTAY